MSSPFTANQAAGSVYGYPSVQRRYSKYLFSQIYCMSHNKTLDLVLIFNTDLGIHAIASLNSQGVNPILATKSFGHNVLTSILSTSQNRQHKQLPSTPALLSPPPSSDSAAILNHAAPYGPPTSGPSC